MAFRFVYIIYSRREGITWSYRIKKIHFQSNQYRYICNIGTSFFHFLQENEKVIKKIGSNIQRCWLLLGKCVMPSDMTFGSRYSQELCALYEICCSFLRIFLIFPRLKMMLFLIKPAEPGWALLWGGRNQAFPSPREKVGVKNPDWPEWKVYFFQQK